MSSEPTNFEDALGSIERDADAAIKSLAAALAVVKRARSAALVGQVRELQTALEASVRLTELAGDAVEQMHKGWSFDVAEWFSSGNYAKELLDTAAEAGVRAYESDQRILCYPVVVAVSNSDVSITVDKKKDRRVRPSVVVKALAELAERPAKSRPEAFLASLAAAYDLVARSNGIRPGAPVKLVEVHRVLTLLPGAARDYTRSELARDLYLLDQSGIVDTRNGRRMSLPASAMTRNSPTLTTVTRDGSIKVYAGIAFTDPIRAERSGVEDGST